MLSAQRLRTVMPTDAFCIKGSSLHTSTPKGQSSAWSWKKKCTMVFGEVGNLNNATSTQISSSKCQVLLIYQNVLYSIIDAMHSTLSAACSPFSNFLSYLHPLISSFPNETKWVTLCFWKPSYSNWALNGTLGRCQWSQVTGIFFTTSQVGCGWHLHVAQWSHWWIIETSSSGDLCSFPDFPLRDRAMLFWTFTGTNLLQPFTMIAAWPIQHK